MIVVINFHSISYLNNLFKYHSRIVSLLLGILPGLIVSPLRKKLKCLTQDMTQIADEHRDHLCPNQILIKICYNEGHFLICYTYNC